MKWRRWLSAAIQLAVHDTRFALRGLRRSPGFTTTAVLTLALGIGATVSAFAVTKAVLFNPLPFPDPDRLVILWERPRSGAPRNPADGFNVTRWRDRNQTFDSIGAIAQIPMNVSGLGFAEQV